MCVDSDLLGDVVVTLDDVDLWLDVIPKLPRNSTRRRESYIRDYAVVEKIKAFKLDGRFYALQKCDIEIPFTLYPLPIPAARFQAAWTVNKKGPENPAPFFALRFCPVFNLVGGSHPPPAFGAATLRHPTPARRF